MKIRKIDELIPGMITAERVFSPKGQFLVEKNSILTAQMIAHMRYYSVASAAIDDDPFRSLDPLAFVAQGLSQETHFQKVRKSGEYHVFQKLFQNRTDSLHADINGFILKNDALDPDRLLAETSDLFSEHTTTISMFDMLHNQRQIDDSTYAHSVNVSIISRMIGIWMEYEAADLDMLTLCGLLHDIGKAQIPQHIIGKPGRLTDEEFEVIKKHPQFGYSLLKKLPLDDRIKNAALMHHERCDGEGYPMGLSGEDIDDFASIVAIADVYDAMTSDRCYRAGLCPFEVIALFEKEGLKKYKPPFILTFLNRIAATYINNNVILSDGRTGKIILINQHLTRPLIQTGPHEFVDLEERLDLYVQAII